MSEQNCKDCLNHRDIGGEYPLRCQLTNVLLRQDGSSGKTCNYYNVELFITVGEKNQLLNAFFIAI